MNDSYSKILIKEIDKIIYWRNSARKYLDNLFLKRNGDSVWQKSRWRVTKTVYHPKITHINHTAPWDVTSYRWNTDTNYILQVGSARVLLYYSIS